MTGSPEFPLLEAYLGALDAELGDEPERERILAEVQDHLYGTTARALDEGLSIEEAQRSAIQRFGTADAVADAFRRLRGAPRAFDARQGLPAPAAEELHRAHRLAVALKDGRTAVLGYCIREPLPGDPDAERYGAVIIPRRDPRREQSWLPPAASFRERPVVIMDLPRNPSWKQRVLPELHAGMHVEVDTWGGLRLWFRPLGAGKPWGIQFNLAAEHGWSPPRVAS